MWFAVVMMVDMTAFILSTCVSTLSACELVFDDTVDGEENLEEKNREVAGIRMYHISLYFLQPGRDMVC